MALPLKIFLVAAVFTFSLQAKVKPELVDKADKFFNVLHFNDAYNVYWAPQFAKKFMSMSDAKTIRTFSGDIYSRSPETRYLKGYQFEALLKAIKLHVAVPGNHEFDMGVDHFHSLQEQDKVPWLLPNVKKNPDLQNHETAISTTKLLESLVTYSTININGFAVCFFGLFDENSFSSSKLSRTDLILTSPLEKAREMSKKLKNEGCDLVVILSHMNNETDEEILKDSENDVDMIFGAHIHQFRVNVINKRLLVKSGYDFLDFSKSKFWFSKTPIQKDIPKDYKYEFVFTDETDHSKAPSTWEFSLAKADDVYLNVKIDKHRVSESDPADEAVKNHLAEKVEPVMSKVKQDIAFSINIPQNFKDSTDRKRIFPLYNFLIDLVRAEFGNDIGMLQTGTFRVTKNFQAGEKISKFDLDSFFRFESDLAQLTIQGSQIANLLNDALIYEKQAVVMAGITFKYKTDGKKQTVVENSIKINGEPLDNNRNYILVTSSFFSTGKITATLKNPEIKNTKVSLKGFNEQEVIMKYMRELVKPEFTKEYKCFKSVFPNLKTDNLIKYFKTAADNAAKKVANFCKATENSPKLAKDKAVELLNTVTLDVLKRLMVYALMGSLKEEKGTNPKTYYEASINPDPFATLEKLAV